MLKTHQGQDVANKWMCWCDATWGRAMLASVCFIDLQNRYASEIAWHKGLKHVSDQKKTLKSGGDDYSTWLVLELELGYLNCLNLPGALLTTGSVAHYLGWKIVLGLFAHHQAPPSEKYAIFGKNSVVMVKTLGSTFVSCLLEWRTLKSWFTVLCLYRCRSCLYSTYYMFINCQRQDACANISPNKHVYDMNSTTFTWDTPTQTNPKYSQVTDSQLYGCFP